MNRLLLIIFFILIFIYSLTFSQNNYVFDNSNIPFIPNTVDLRNLGMGKTGVVNKTGSSSLFINPSCLAAMDSLSMTAGFDFKFGLISNPKQSDSLKSLGANFRSSNTPLNFNLSHLAFGMPFHFKNSTNPFSIGIGLGYHSPYNLNNTYTNIVKFPTLKYEFREKITGGIKAISLGFGIGILNKYYLGVALNKSIVNRLRIYSEKSIVPKNGNKTGINTNLKIHNDAFYHIFGAMVQPVKKLTLGMKIVSKFKWDFDTYESELDDSITQFDEGRIDQEVTMPALYAFGIEYTIIPAITLAIEYQTRLFEYFLVNGEELVKEDDIDNGFSINIGTEIRAGKIPVRLGMFIESLPYTDYHYIPYKRSDKPIKMFGLTSGFRVPIKALNFNFGFSWSYYKKEEYDTTSAGIEYFYKHIKNDFNFDFGISSQFRVKTKEIKDKASLQSIQVPAKEVKSSDTLKQPESVIKADSLIEEKKDDEHDTVIIHWQVEEKSNDLKDSTESKDTLLQNKETKKIRDKQLTISQDTSSQDNLTITSNADEELKDSVLQEVKKETNESDNLWADDENLFEAPIEAPIETPPIKAGDFVSITLTSGKEFKGLVHDLDEEKYVLDIQGNKIIFYRIAVRSIEKR